MFNGPDTYYDECDCERPGPYYTGISGIFARIENGRANADTVHRCVFCERYPSDDAALQVLLRRGMVKPRSPDMQDIVAFAMASIGFAIASLTFLAVLAAFVIGISWLANFLSL